jgi:hypothetical protein
MFCNPVRFGNAYLIYTTSSPSQPLRNLEDKRLNVRYHINRTDNPSGAEDQVTRTIQEALNIPGALSVWHKIVPHDDSQIRVNSKPYPWLRAPASRGIDTLHLVELSLKNQPGGKAAANMESQFENKLKSNNILFTRVG